MDEAAASRELVAGRYEIVRALGRGGMGEVLLARQLNLDRLVVLKRAADPRPEIVRALADEGRVAARLHHPNIVTVLDVIEREHDPVVVMELVAGVSLREVIDRARGELPIAVALAIACDVLRGLAYAHAVRSGAHTGIVHGDVNPRNIMVTFAGATKLIDFGISRWLGHRDIPAGSGTRGYMAPEQASGDPLDGRADQFGFGATLRDMIGAARVAELDAIVARACAADRDSRFATCAELHAAIEAVLERRGTAATATHVERWMHEAFAAELASFERDAEPRRAPRAPTAPTVIGSDLRAARIAFVARNSGASGDDWLAPVIERMVCNALRESGERRFTFEAGAAPEASTVELAFAREATQIRVTVARDGREGAVASSTSVAGCIDSLVRDIAHELGTGRSSRGPRPDETAAIQQLGARTFESLLAYRRIAHAYYTYGLPDSIGLARATKQLVDDDPTWAHPYALLAQLAGRTTVEAIAAIDAGLARADAERDPTGMQLVIASQHLAHGETESAYEVLSRVVAVDDTDLLAMSTLVLIDVSTHRTDEATALTRRLHDHYPDLMFGVDLADAYRRTGRARAAGSAVEAWVAAVPENLAARVELARQSALAGDTERASEQARAMLLVHGERAEALPDLFEAMVASGQLPIAHRIADRMLLGDELTRARGRYRGAIVAVLEGRFAAGYDAVRRAVTEHRAFAFQSELAQCLELARTLAPLAGDARAQRAYTEELVRVFDEVVGDPAAAAATRFELALLDRHGGPPSIDDALHELADGSARDVARRRMLRAAAVADCGSPHKAVAAGFSAFEDNAASLVALGTCALRLRELELARASFERARHTWSAMLSNQCSAYHAVLARFHLGVTAIELGDIAGARSAFEALLVAWGDADRPISEVATARTLLAQLR